jgi:hypothetical protein
MPRYELPIVVRLSQQELAEALRRPIGDLAVQRLGGLTVVLRPARGPRREVPADLVGMLGSPASLMALAGAFRPVEPALFRVLRACRALAKRFVLDAEASLNELAHSGDHQGFAK